MLRGQVCPRMMPAHDVAFPSCLEESRIYSGLPTNQCRPQIMMGPQDMHTALPLSLLMDVP